jgi:hypothetical protein
MTAEFNLSSQRFPLFQRTMGAHRFRNGFGRSRPRAGTAVTDGVKPTCQCWFELRTRAGRRLVAAHACVANASALSPSRRRPETLKPKYLCQTRIDNREAMHQSVSEMPC